MYSYPIKKKNPLTPFTYIIKNMLEAFTCSCYLTDPDSDLFTGYYETAISHHWLKSVSKFLRSISVFLYLQEKLYTSTDNIVVPSLQKKNEREFSKHARN